MLTGKALDDYAAEDMRKPFGNQVKVAPTVQDVADHIDRAVNVAGIAHVGIGSDFDGISGLRPYFEDAGAHSGPAEAWIC